MAENTLQWQWIVTIAGGLQDLFAENPNVFVASDLFWYPVEGRPDIVAAPDALVAFGRPTGHRGSYRQWEEGGIAPQVVFEVLSPGNRAGELSRKFGFYQRYGVEEYYIYDPGPLTLELSGFLRRQDELVEIEAMNGHVSPRLGIRFEMAHEGLRIVRPDGTPFLTYQQQADARAPRRSAVPSRLRGAPSKLRAVPSRRSGMPTRRCATRSAYASGCGHSVTTRPSDA